MGRMVVGGARVMWDARGNAKSEGETRKSSKVSTGREEGERTHHG